MPAGSAGPLPRFSGREGRRYWEIDCLRGLAVFMMIGYHLLFDLNFLGIAVIPVAEGILRLFALSIAFTFIFVAGISVRLSAWRHSGEGYFALSRWHLLRALKILVSAGAVTLVTFAVIPGAYVRFGILHCIGVSILLAPFFFDLGAWTLIPASFCILAGYTLNGVTGDGSLLWLGVVPEGFRSVDYVPLLPWFGVILLGVFAAQQLYPGGAPRFRIPADPPLAIQGVLWAGRNSLVVYLLHQPLLVGFLLLLFPEAASVLL